MALNKFKIHYLKKNFFLGSCDISAVDSLVLEDVSTRGEDNKEDNHDAEKDEGDGTERDIFQVLASKCS